MRLVERHPEVDLEELLQGFAPPPRFRGATFLAYRPDPRYPSQALAKERLRRWVHDRPQGLFRRRMPGPQGIYLDGGFGVGKTHLLVAAYLEAPPPKAFLTFEELTYTLGLMGLREGARRFSGLRYLFLDEFELDDPGNAQMITHFLALTMEKGLRVATTSNTPPGALGEGRFNAEQFRHQIQSLAKRFAVERIEGEDFRHRDPERLPEPLSDGALLALYREDPRRKSLDAFPELLAHLRTLHPIRYRYLFRDLEVVYLQGLAPIPDQNDALRFVHFVDQLYNLGLPLRASGVPLREVFPESYRHGPFAKKYGRALSRLAELLG
ncbi:MULTISPECIES: cell division protein ZapE [Thermus]|jgi:cell division protein ZapE|uniref:Cell division protein ZapE n=2 Tax=Thermus brockianus TaxID=56956 RepID=A0ABN6NGC4_THEBO|nr:cell division protein ZapE [Thermus brockianus]BDG15455.1 cell division protein ZapE [Thermus brockianus]